MDHELCLNWNYPNGCECSVKISDIAPLYEAIRVNNVHLIEHLLKQGENVNGSVLPHGPFAGYTILHFASMKEDYSFVLSLLFVYKVNPNAVAKDGARPITVATLFKKNVIVEVLLRAGANVDEELSNCIQIKYKASFKSPEDEWCHDFGSRMTLLTYAVLNNYIELVDILIRYNADWKIRSRSNKTLLMCAVDKLQGDIVSSLVKVMSKDEINLRDNDGFTALHYLVKRNELKWRYDASTLKTEPIIRILSLLLKAGADINATINGDPGTLFLNIAAYRGMYPIIYIVLRHQNFSANCKPLFYASKTDNKLAYDPNCNRSTISSLKDTKKLTIVSIVKSLRLRQRLGLSVLEEEILIMYNLLETGYLPGWNLDLIDSDVNRVFDILKSNFITFDGQSMSSYDILTTSNKKFLQLAKDHSFCTAIHSSPHQRLRYSELIEFKLEEAKKHIEILNKCKEKSFYITKTFYYLPFDCIWEIIKYLPCSDLENFINALIPQENSEKNETVLK